MTTVSFPVRLLAGAIASACLSWSGVAAAQTPAQPAPAVKPAKLVQPKPDKKDDAEAEPAKPAQAKPATTADPAPDAGVVTVVAERPVNRIDRQVYDVKTDVAATNNSAADALANVPSVSVDPDGTVMLRGSTNVQILVDGKPSAMLQGEGRGAALNAMSAQDIDSIEVINNPGAQFGNEGGGGPILNLIMRRNRAPGGMGVASLNAGPSGRANGSMSGSYHEGLWGIQGGINFRRDGRNSVADATRDRIDPVTGAISHSEQHSTAVGLNNATGMNGGVSYSWSEKTALSAQFNLNRRGNDQHGTDNYHYDNTGLFPLSDYVRTTERSGDSASSGWSLRMDHKGSLPGETLKLDLRVSDTDVTNDNAYRNIYANSQLARDRRSRMHSVADNSIRDFTGDYERPAEGGLLKLGYKIAQLSNGFDTAYTDIDPLTGVGTVNYGRTNSFKVDETNLAVYGSYQHSLSERWSVLGGMRVEHTGLDVYQLTNGTKSTNSYVNCIPSLFFSYKASDKANLRLAYAHRIRRPNGNDLNPFIVYRDEQNVSAGNPQLRPTQQDSFEVGYETKYGLVDTNLRAYFRKDRDLIAERSYFISDTVLLTTRDNAGSSRSGGIEYTLSGKLSPTLSFNTSGNFARFEQSGVDSLGVATKRSASHLGMRGRLNIAVTPEDQLQVSVNMQGKTLTGTGYREPNATANLSLRHTLTPRLNLVVNVTDLFDSNKMVNVIDTSYLHENTTRHFDGRLVYVGLSYRFGGVTQAPGGRQGNRGQGGPGGPGGRNGPPPGGADRPPE